MRELPYVIECKSFARFYEPIAAFNSEGVAHYYMENCRKTNPMFSYRIVTHKGEGYGLH